MYKKVSIIGAGTWGLAIASHISLKTSVDLIHYRNDFLKILEDTRKHPNISNFLIPENILMNYSRVIESDLYIVATPVQYIREIFDYISIAKKTPILILSKGIESDTLMFPIDIIKEKIGWENKKLAILSGPSHAEQVIKGHPTSVVVSSENSNFSKSLQSLFSSSSFRVYCNNDILGVQLGGAVKNVISIAAGIAYGLGYRENTISALLTRGLHEIKKLGIKMGVRKNTLNGLAGLGDLMVTSFSKNSRNRHVGIQIGKGGNLSLIIEELKMNAEGIETSKSLHFLIEKLNIDLPICEKVYQILHLNKDPEKSIKDLMTRKLINEF